MSRGSSATRIRERFPARLAALEALASGHVLDLGAVAGLGTGSGDRVVEARSPYDTIVSVGVLCELPSADVLDGTARLLAQALAPDGRLLFAEPEARSGLDVRDALWRNGLTVVDSRAWSRRSLLPGRAGPVVIGGVARLTPPSPYPASIVTDSMTTGRDGAPPSALPSSGSCRSRTAWTTSSPDSTSPNTT